MEHQHQFGYLIKLFILISVPFIKCEENDLNITYNDIFRSKLEAIYVEPIKSETNGLTKRFNKFKDMMLTREALMKALLADEINDEITHSYIPRTIPKRIPDDRLVESEFGWSLTNPLANKFRKLVQMMNYRPPELFRPVAVDSTSKFN